MYLQPWSKHAGNFLKRVQNQYKIAIHDRSIQIITKHHQKITEFRQIYAGAIQWPPRHDFFMPGHAPSAPAWSTPMVTI